MTVAYIAVFVLSLLLPPAYFFYFEKSQREPWLFGLFISISVTNLGYLLLSVSKTVQLALLFNKLAYFGQVLVILCMFKIISKLCGVAWPKWVNVILTCLAGAILSLVCTAGYLDWYYRSVTLSYENGATKLVKEYGALHPLYLIYVLAYFGAMLCVILRSFQKRKSGSLKLASLMLVVVLGNIGMWIVEKFIPLNFEFLSISYLMSEFVLFFVYVLLQDYIRIADLPDTHTDSPQAKPSVIFVNSSEHANRLEAILAHLPENTVKMHTSTLFKALGVNSREDIFAILQS